MLIIGHRGAAGLAPENTIDALQAGVDAGADMLEFDVRQTRDGVLVLAHDSHTLRSHHHLSFISQLTLKELQEKQGERPLCTLQEVLDRFLGVVLLNIELKSTGSGHAVTSLLQERYIHRRSDWESVILASFKTKELLAARQQSREVNLALLHAHNPFTFVAFERRLRLTAVGFHRLYANQLALAIAKKAGLFTYVYTVDRPHAALILEQRGVDGIVTNYPDRILREITR